MAHAANPFGDYTKIFGEFKFPAFEMPKMFELPKLPHFDFNGLFSIQRRNIEALTSINQVVAQSFQSISKRQAEILQNTVQEFISNAKDMFSSATPETNATKQAEFARKSFEKGLANVRELVELAAESNGEAFEVLNKRAVEAMEDFNKLAKKAA